MLKPLYNKISIAVRLAVNAQADCVRSIRMSGARGAGAGSMLLAVLTTTPVFAIGLGELRVQSGLGQPLRATVALLGADAGSRQPGCYTARLASADGAFIVNPRVVLINGPGRGLLSLSSTLPISEPALALQLEVSCGDLIRKEFAVLLDPPLTLPDITQAMLQTADVMPGQATDQHARNGDTGRRPAIAGLNQATRSRIVIRRSKGPAIAHATPQANAARSTPATAGLPASHIATPHQTAPAKNVLRLTSHEGENADLLNAIGLRLALADRLSGADQAARGGGSSTSRIPDLAQSAAKRAAQVRFAAILKDDPNADNVVQAAMELRLQSLLSKMQSLENETARLRQASQKSTTNAITSPEDSHLLWILSALLALSLAATAWLILRMKHFRGAQQAWSWNQNGSTAGSAPGPEKSGWPDVAVASASPGEPASRPAPFDATFHADPAHPDAVPTPAGPGHVTPPGRAEPVLIVPPMEFMLDAPMLPRASSGHTASTSLPAEALANPASDARVSPAPDDLHFAEIRLQHPAVEEISDVMQEAEFWISLRDSQRAIEVLEPYATFEQPNSPLPWLYLFDLYMELGQQEKYDVLHEQFQRVFNARVPTWVEQKLAADDGPVSGPAVSRSIADVPYVAEKITELWQTGDIVPYLESLLVDDRDGHRSGFDLPVYREIIFLIALAYEIAQSEQVEKPAGEPGWTLAA